MINNKIEYRNSKFETMIKCAGSFRCSADGFTADFLWKQSHPIRCHSIDTLLQSSVFILGINMRLQKRNIDTSLHDPKGITPLFTFVDNEYVNVTCDSVFPLGIRTEQNHQPEGELPRKTSQFVLEL